MLKKIRIKMQAALLLSVFMLVSCSENPSSTEEQPPQLPSVQSMSVDFSAFEEEGSQKERVQYSTDNFGTAAVTAGFMKFVVDVNLAIPRALLAAAAESDAHLEEGIWEWNFTKTTGDHNYGVRLLAERAGEETVDWEFYVTNSELGLDNRLFFRGTTMAGASEGSWSYYSLQQNEEGVHVSEISWAVHGEDDVQLKLEVISNRHERQGDFLEYSFDGTFKTAVYFNAGTEKETVISWNTETGAGYIISPDYNKGQKACWDENLQDIACEA